MSRSTTFSRRLWGGIAAVVLVGCFLARGLQPAAARPPTRRRPRKFPLCQARNGGPAIGTGLSRRRSRRASAGAPPADAIVLFDGKDLSQWESDRPKADAPGGPLQGIEDGAINIMKTGQIRTKQKFGDCQLHVEWATPERPDGDKYIWGNSGVFFIKDYELQIIESHDSHIYADGNAGAIYNQTPPLVNPSAGRASGRATTWSSAPRGSNGEKVTSPGFLTVFWNGVLVQDHTALMGSTMLHNGVPRYTTHQTTGPIMLQYHRSAVRFRNVWVRPLTAD